MPAVAPGAAERRWAEYLAFLGTGGFLPIELYELARAFWSTLAVLLFNALLAAYLVHLLVAGARRPSRTTR